MSEIKVTQTRSAIGSKPKQRGTLRALGLGRIGKSNVLTDGPVVQAEASTTTTTVDAPASSDGGEGSTTTGEPPADAAGWIPVEVKSRARHAGVAARVRELPGGRAEVEFAEPQRGVAPGQAAVFYRGTRVLGGCWIDRGASPAEDDSIHGKENR